MSTIVMPRLSDTMEEGTILRWLKADGEQVARGEELVEIETDKATMTYESDLAGTIRLLAAEGETLAVGQPIATVGDEDEIGARPQSGAAPDGARPPDAAPPAQAAPQTAPDAAGGERVKASPLARRVAQEGGVDLAGVTGSGPGGRIVKADIEAAAASGTSAGGGAGAAEGPPSLGGAEAAEGPPGLAGAGTADGPPSLAGAGAAEGSASLAGADAAAGPPSLAGVATAKGETREVELSKTQQTVARRMAESKATIPDFTLRIEVDMEDCVTLRGQLKRVSAAAADEVPTYNDMVVKACALALREHPLANGSYRDGKLQLYSRVNVGVAVAAEGALVVPTIFDADAKALGEVARETRALAARVRSGEITPPELGGGTFTVSNLGMFGIESFAAIINPPQAAIMSVGSLAQRATVRDGELAARHTMSLTLVCDHRILYGAPAAEFLARVRELLESPAALTL